MAAVVGVLVSAVGIAIVTQSLRSTNDRRSPFRSAEGVAPEALAPLMLPGLADGAAPQEADAVLSRFDISVFAGPDDSARVARGLIDDGFVTGLRRVYVGPDGTVTRIQVFQFASAAGAADARRWLTQRWLRMPGGTFEPVPADQPDAVIVSARVPDASGRLERGLIAAVSHYVVDIDVQGVDIDAARPAQLDVLREQLAALSH